MILKYNFFMAGIFMLLTGCVMISGSNPEYDKAERKEVTVRQTDRGVEVTVNEAIFFDSGKFELKPESNDVLERISTILRDRTRRDILIEGHTDNLGSAKLNQHLSEKRAESVKKGLVERDVPTNRMKAVGWGFSKPIASNDSAEGRRMNRRTEIVLVGETTENIGGDGAIQFLEGAVARLKELHNSVLDLFRR